MSTSEQLKNEALAVNDLLTKYIGLHDKYLKSAGTFSSLFRKVDFRALAGEAYFLFEEIRDKKSELECFKELALNSKEKNFVDCLISYTTSLTETTHLLFILLHALQEKAEGNDLSLKEHLENSKKYEESINTYLFHGEELNKAYSEL